MKQLFALLFLFGSLHVQAQFTASGIVRDASSGSVLPFAGIATATGVETRADVDGKFTLQSSTPPGSMTVFYTGYVTRHIALSDHNKYYDIALTPETRQPDHGRINSPNNPANQIIAKAIQSRSHNDPRKKLSAFRFMSYNKLVITANPDSIEARIDSVFIERKNLRKFSKLDSSNYKFSKLIAKQHLFLTEKVSRFEYDDNRLKETIIGVRMAGFSQPVYEVIAFHLQSFSVYDEKYELFETDYNSPISSDAAGDYEYRLLDTIDYQQRKTYLVYFKPKRDRKGNGLRGLLYIDSDSFAIAKAIMRIKGVLDISGIHDFKYIASEQLWFPTAREFKIVKGNNDEDIRILGETLKFDADGEDGSIRKKQASDFTYLLSKSSYFDAGYNVPVSIRKRSIAVTVDEQAISRGEDFWAQYRQDSIDVRTAATYTALDSMARKRKIEKKLRIGRKILNGYLPLGPVDLDLRYLLSYNNYEGFRLGLGGVTSEKFSRMYKIEGYTGYGTKDGAFKYSLGAAARIGKFSNTWIGGGYTDDVREIASSSFAIDKRVFKLYDPRPINVSTFYGYQSWKAYIETRIIPKTESIWQLTHSRIDPKFAYTFAPDGVPYESYYMTMAMVSLQWNPFSEYMQTPVGRLETEKRFPKFTFQYTQAIPGVLKNDFAFGKIDFRAEYEKKYLDGQKSAFLIEAGYATGEVPLTHLYNSSPNNLTKDRLLQRITLAGKNSFETMYFNEFFSSEYVMFQLKHGFQRLQLFRKVKPIPVFVTRMTWGNMKDRERHIGIDFKTLDKGYFESGIELNKIFKGFGLSGFYRYGPNQLPRTEDNIAVKLSFRPDLGF